MVDPRSTMLATSLDVLVDDIRESFSDIQIEKHEKVIPVEREFSNFKHFKMYEFYVKNNGYYNDDDEFIIEEMRIDFDSENHYENTFGTNMDIDPTDTIKITNANMNMVLTLAKKLASKQHLRGWGMLLTDEKENFFNPLHPLMLLDMDHNSIPFNNNFTIILFMGEDSIDIPIDGSDYNSIKENIENIINHIKEHKDTVDYGDNDIDNQIENMRGLDINELIQKQIRIDNQPKYIITPIEMASTQGVVYPYYGIIDSIFDDYIYGSRILTASMNGNINFYNKLEDEAREYEDEEEAYIKAYTYDSHDSTCIGKYASNYWKNLRHMNIMNMDSMYINYIIPDDNLMFYEAHAMMRISIEMLKALKKKGVFDGKEEEEEA